MLDKLRALGDETRLHMVRLLLKRRYCVTALANQLGISPAAVSQHLKVLRQAGLVRGEKRRYWVHYKVDTGALKHLAREIAAMTATAREECDCNQCNRCLRSCEPDQAI